jgi:hypothetical protein
MPDKQLVFTIPQPNKDGTCNEDCPFHRYTHGELAMCYLGFHKRGNIEIYPDKGCPQSNSKDKITQNQTLWQEKKE